LMRCEPCREAKEFLARHDIAYRSVTVDWQLPEQRIAVKKRLEQAYGDRPIYPVLELDGQLHFGFDAGRWAALLNLTTV
jgi:glutaredoxin